MAVDTSYELWSKGLCREVVKGRRGSGVGEGAENSTEPIGFFTLPTNTDATV